MKINEITPEKEILYYVTFRIEKDDEYEATYNCMLKFINQIAGSGIWDDPTSYILFKSTKTISQIAKGLKKCIDPSCDLILVSEVKTGKMVYSGVLKNKSLLSLAPWVKKV